MLEFLILSLSLYALASTVFGVFFFLSLRKIKNKYRVDPSYETQLMFADLMRGNALFHIERVEPQNIFLRRD